MWVFDRNPCGTVQGCEPSKCCRNVRALHGLLCERCFSQVWRSRPHRLTCVTSRVLVCCCKLQCLVSMNKLPYFVCYCALRCCSRLYMRLSKRINVYAHARRTHGLNTQLIFFGCTCCQSGVSCASAGCSRCCVSISRCHECTVVGVLSTLPGASSM